jgi:hypothetical protein
MISLKHSNPVQHRLANVDDMAFIHASWSSSERANTSAVLVPNNVYYADERNKINHLLNVSTTMVVHVEGKPDTLLGFMTYQYTVNHQIIHYAFVKSPFRQYGILSNLIELTNYNKGIVVTCEPNVEVFQALNENSGYALVYDHFYFTRERFLNG